MSVEEDKQRYFEAMHGVQSGVAYLMNVDPNEVSPKHLRVGVNSSFVGQEAIVKLLMNKGIITEEEYFKELADGAEKERDSYQQKIQEMYPNTNINLR